MTRPLNDLRPGAGGFNPYVPQREVPFITFAGLVWAAILISLAIAALLVFVRLTHHQPRALDIRPTIQPRASWLDEPLRREGVLSAKLEQTEDRP